MLGDDAAPPIEGCQWEGCYKAAEENKKFCEEHRIAFCNEAAERVAAPPEGETTKEVMPNAENVSTNSNKKTAVTGDAHPFKHAPEGETMNYFGPCPKCGTLLGFGHLPEKCEAVASPAMSAEQFYSQKLPRGEINDFLSYELADDPSPEYQRARIFQFAEVYAAALTAEKDAPPEGETMSYTDHETGTTWPSKSEAAVASPAPPVGMTAEEFFGAHVKTYTAKHSKTSEIVWVFRFAKDYADHATAHLRGEVARLRDALQGIIDIGKRDFSNPKYDGYFDSARAALESTQGGQEGKP